MPARQQRRRRVSDPNLFQRQVEARREQLGLSWDEFERRSGVPASTLRLIVQGPMTRPPTQAQRIGMARALRWPLPHLVRLVRAAFGLEITRISRPDLEILVASAAELSPREVAAVQLVVDTLRGEPVGPTEPATAGPAEAS
jgi:transcriptional regulator with XRE-family HTH domain